MIRKRKRGFTLIEMIIVMSLTVIILGMVYSMFNTNNRILSDVNIKSTLQLEGQAIQEKLSYIGMQATGVIDYDNKANKKNIIIRSYNKDGDETSYNIEYNESEKILAIDNNVGTLSTHVQSLEIVPNIFELKNKSELNNIKFIEFKIQLGQNKGFSNINDSNYPLVSVIVNFRNKDIKED